MKARAISVYSKERVPKHVTNHPYTCDTYEKYVQTMNYKLHRNDTPCLLFLEPTAAMPHPIAAWLQTLAPGTIVNITYSMNIFVLFPPRLLQGEQR